MPTTLPAPSPRGAPPRDRDAAFSADTHALIDLLVSRRLRGRQIQAPDLDDLKQDLTHRLLLAYPRFNPARGTWAAYVTVVVRGALSKAIRQHCRRSRRQGQSLSLADANPRVIHRIEQATATQASDPAIGVIDGLCFRDVVTSLLPDDRYLAELLMDHAPAEVLRRTGWCKRRLYDAISRLRVAFAQAGFGGAL